MYVLEHLLCLVHAFWIGYNLLSWAVKGSQTQNLCPGTFTFDIWPYTHNGAGYHMNYVGSSGSNYTHTSRDGVNVHSVDGIYYAAK